MGRVFEAFKRAERAPLEPRINFDIPRDNAASSASRVVGFNRPQRAKHDDFENGRVQHLANAEMLARLTNNDEEHYVEDLMERRAANKARENQTATSNSISPVTNNSNDTSFITANNDDGISVNGDDKSSATSSDGQVVMSGRGDKAPVAASVENDSTFTPPAPLSDTVREERRRRIAEMLQASRVKEPAVPSNDSPRDASPSSESSLSASNVVYRTPGFEPPSVLFSSSRYFKSPQDKAAEESTSTERIENTFANGSALSIAEDSRVAGATVDVGGTARATPKELDFPSIEVSAARVEPHLISITEPHSPHTERFRALRTRVLHAGEKKGMKSFVITSANQSEGKTLTALNLAWLLAQTEGVRALLIDGDLRQPCVADYLDIEPKFGLSEILDGHCKLTDAIVNLQPAGLHFLSGGKSQIARDRVAEMFAGPTFNKVLAEAREMFDYVIMDAPPLGVFTDASLLINRADAALLVVRAGKTRYASLDRLLEPLPRERILGVVLNGSDEPMNESNYYYYSKRKKSDE